MKQRGFVIPVTLILYAVAAAAVLGAIAFMKYEAEHWCNKVCTSARAERDQLAKEKTDALRREAAIATLYGQQVEATAAAESARERERAQRTAEVRAQVRALPAADAGVRVPAAVVRVLDAAASGANAAGTAGRAPEATAPAATGADSTGGLVAEWFADVAAIHAECRDRVAAWESFYSGLRAAQGVPIEQVH